MANETDTGSRLRRKISQARLALGVERLWSVLLWPALILGTAAVAVLSGALPFLPPWLRALLLAAGAAALLWSLVPLGRQLRAGWASRQEAMRRVEERSGLAHRPVSAQDDKLPDGVNDSTQKLLWEEHRLRQLRRLDNLKAGLPVSTWRDSDPHALRLLVILGLAVALLLGPGSIRERLAASLATGTAAASPQLALDAWLKPPAYTGKTPLLLTSPAIAERLKQEPEIHVPENSVLSLRISGAEAPKLTFRAPVEGTATAPEVEGFKPQVKTENGLFQADVKLTRPAVVEVTDGTRLLGSWRLSLIPDAAPGVEIIDTPKGDSSGRLIAKWKVTDDYGVTGVTSDIYLADEQDDGVGFTDTGIFEFDPPKLAIQLRRAAPQDETGESRADVAQHPWAGFMVEMTLTARDAAGNTTESAKRTFRLPERAFTRPLARALIEQRRRLILNPEEAGGVAEMLDAIVTYPKGLIERSGTQIAIAAALSRLRSAGSQADVDTVISELWQIAVNIEDGVSADAKADLEAARKALEKALREGAPPERIAELTKKLRQALDRYMESMMKEAQKRLAEGNQKQDGQQQPGKVVTPQDLQKMLDMIDKLSKSGNNEAAEKLLSQLEDILRNLKPGMPQQGQGQGQDSPLGQMLDKLSDLMRKQQKLMDETQRMPQPGMGEEGQQDGQQPGSDGQQGMGSLGDRQQGLGQMLDELMKQFGQNGMQAPQPFGQAGKNMDRAEGSLRDGDREEALREQGEAMSRLREGARGMAEQLMQQSRGQQDSQGRDGQARGDDRDPLGRPLPSRGEEYGPEKGMLPSEQAMERARQILDMLRARAGDLGLPKYERDYIDRLLRGLY
ncbi:TIGR02302 family protein [Aestuariivirga litoralis]|uniref:TIGR02302 family protein n=1 Tax=Aestuariivirga litoralis TaxID=2650924 RepID=A0A2W2AXC8_9HYPH|nr:TIGR02302 family protein [Aestuariivirga litoralis]PZF77280.1 TIGR02302 family protein [Aestuariivirga litoralis]